LTLPRAMYATLIAETPSAEVFAAVSREWLAGALDEVFPALREGLRTRPVVTLRPRSARDTLGAAWGEPGHILGELGIYQKRPGYGGREVVYSEQAWERFLVALAGYPWVARIEIRPLDDRGRPGGYPPTEMRVARNVFSPAWATFTFSAPAEDTGWPQSAQTQDSWAEFVRRQAAEMGACAGSMTDDIGPSLSALQRATRNGGPCLTASPEVLQGYSWITVVPAELAGKLGEARALTATGAFHEVSTLPNGALWLRATPTVDDFAGDRVRMVFEALAPVLLTGTAEFAFGEKYRIVEGVDAADYR
jgi:hypothetical protein